MQTLREIRELLSSAALRPNRRLGQCFLIDKNLMAGLLDLAETGPDDTVLEVGPGTGSLTEELLGRARTVVAVELDRGLAEVVRRRLGGRGNLTLLTGDVLAGKHEIRPDVLAALGPTARLVSNLPYNVATPLLAECLKIGTVTYFARLTFTVQREVADRLTARPGAGDYGSISVLVALLGRVTVGPAVPASAFWPRPKVDSRILRIDRDDALAARVADLDALCGLVALAFAQRRKQIGSLPRRAGGRIDPSRFDHALRAAGVEPSARPEEIAPEQYVILSSVLRKEGR